jgi:hypothetical protein
MSDRRFVWRILCCTLRIYVNPLYIARHPGKIVDSLLIYFQPRTDMNFLAEELLVSGDEFIDNRHLLYPSALRWPAQAVKKRFITFMAMICKTKP